MPSTNGMQNIGFELELSDIGKDSKQDLSQKIVPVRTKVDKNANNDIMSGSSSTNNLEDFGDETFRCGIGCFSPEWVQGFATKRSFMIVFSLLGVVQSMSSSYFNATISTLEKRFKISTQTAGIVMTGNEISQIIFSLILSHYGGKGHRPRWIAVGVLFSAFSCFVLASPHILYGSGNDSLSQTEEYHSYDRGSANSGHNRNVTSIFGSNGSAKGKVNLCKRTRVVVDESCEESETIAPLVFIFLSQFVSGIGHLLYMTLGGPYLDDNTKRKNIPIVFGIMMSLRLVGPTLGFLIASGTLKLYVNPLLTPLITPEDPRWIGAWWLGWVIFGTLMTISACFIALFPHTLRRKAKGEIKELKTPETVPKLSDIPRAVKMLLKNKINICNNMAGVFYLFSGNGYWTFMPKYMETIFMQTASNASVMSGVVGILSNAAGILLSGFLISRFRFSARKLALWNVITAFSYVGVKVLFTQIGCDAGKIDFGTERQDGTWNLTSACNQDCNCKTSKIRPICYKEENTVFYSACHAGCSVYENNTIGNCSCIADLNATVQLGNCAENCAQIFMLFLTISAFIKFIDATGRIGNLLISYRCVTLEERSLSLGLHLVLFSVFAFLPAPIVFGRIIDSVCLVWGGSTCGKQGNCMLYNGQQLRYLFNLTAASFTFAGACFDCIVWYLVKDMDLYKEPDEVVKHDCVDPGLTENEGGAS